MGTKLSTPIVPAKIGHRIELDDTLLSLGSCFSEHIARKLTESRFLIDVNPTGILYNPISILQAIRRLNENRPYSADELFEFRGQWRSFDHHGDFSDPSPEQLLAHINDRYSAAASGFARCDYLFLTFGTACTWFLKEQPERAVANCHRLPDSYFERRLVCHEEIVAAYRPILDALFTERPDIYLILTVSPVRYLKGRATENSVSKSHLHIAVNALAEAYPNVSVFPAYEILIDELRDYRFYNRDLVHPSDLAIDMIWERFCSHCLSEHANTFIKDYETLLHAMRHRPHHQTSSDIRRFAESTLERIGKLAEEYPTVDFSQEKGYFLRLTDA